MEEQQIKITTAILAEKTGLPRFINSNGDLECYDIAEKRYINYRVFTFFPSKTEYIYTPKQSVLQKWLRDDHGIHVTVFYIGNHSYEVRYGTTDKKSIDHTLINCIYDSHEEALECGLVEGLKLIKNN